MGCVQASLEDPRGFHRSSRASQLLRQARRRQVIGSAPSWASLRGLLGCQQEILRPSKSPIRPSRHGEETNWASEVLERTVSVMGGDQAQEAQLDYVLVTGAEVVLLPYMGTFFKSNLEPTALQAYRPIYQNVNGKQLYYRASWGLWLLSEGGVHESDVWMGRAYAKDDVECPTNARGWIVWDGMAWNTSYTLHVTETDGTFFSEAVESGRPMQFLHEKQPPPPQRLSLREAEEALGLPRARELVAPLKQGLSVSAWVSKHGVWMQKTLKVDSRANFLSLGDNEELQEWRLQRIMVVLDGSAAQNLCSLLNINIPESAHLSVALHGSWEGAAKRENVLAFCCEAEQDLPSRLRAAVSLAPSPGAALRAAAKVLQAQQRFRAVRQDLKKRKEQRLQKAAGGLVSAQVKDGEALLNVASWPPSTVLELEVSLRSPGLEMETHSAEIPAKFKPENALVIAEKIAAQVSVSEDVHVLDKELLSQEIKEILRLFRCFGNMPTKGYRGKLFMSDESWSSILKDGDLIALHQSLQEVMTIRPLRLCMMQRLHLEGVCHRLSEHAARTSRRVDPDLSLPLVSRSADLFGPRCRPRQMARRAWGDAPANLEVDQQLQGTWYYEPNGCFHIKFQDGMLYFEEQVESCCYGGTLQPEGVHFSAQLFSEDVLQGTMRMRRVGEYLIANFRESSEDPWSPDILAHQMRRESTNSSRSGRGPLKLEMQEKRNRNFSNFSAAFFEPKGTEELTALRGPEPDAGEPPTLEELRLREIFDAYARENHGYLDLQGFRRLCFDLGHPVQSEESAQAMARLDANRSGHCSFEEFKGWWMAPPGSHFSLPILDFLKFSREGFFSLGLAWPRVVDEARLREVFNHFDRDKSGRVDLQELRNVSADLGVTMTSQEVETAMQELSPNKGSSCTFEDFRDWWMSHNSKNTGLLSKTLVKAGIPFGIPWLTR